MIDGRERTVEPGTGGPAVRVGFLDGGGVMGARLRARDWSGTPLGPQADWPQPLKTLVAVMLAAGQPMFVAWGEARTLLYNDAYAPLLGERDAGALGRPFMEVWPEVRGELTPLFDRVFAGEPVHMDDISLRLERGGRLEEAHFAFSYTPVRDERGVVAGLFCACTETTDTVLARTRADSDRKRLAQMFEQGPSFLAMLQGRDHRIQFANPAYRRLVGDREVVGRTVAEALPDAVAQGFLGLLDEVFESGRPFSSRGARYAVEPVAGGPVDERFVDFVFQPLTEPDGTITGILVEGVDVTDMRLAEAALRASEAQFRAFAQAMPNHVWAASPSGRLDWFNERVYEFSGLSPGALEGDGWAVMVHPDDRPLTAARWAAVLETGEPYETEFRLRRADGVYRWHLARAVAIRDETGVVVQWIGSNTEVEEQKAASDAVRRLNEELEARVEERTRERDRVWRHSRDLIVVVGADGLFRAVSPAWRAILGHEPQDVVGRSFVDFVWPDDVDRTGEALDAAVSRADLTNFENRYRHRDGSVRWISWLTSVEGDRVYAYGRDVTAEKGQAAALVQVEEALRQSQKMEALGQLTGGIAHDFNNLLTGIIGSLDIVRRRLTARRLDDIPRFMEAATTSAQRAAALTHRLLAFARRQSLDTKPNDVNALVAGLEDILTRSLGERVELATQLSADLWPALTDANQLENAVLNLAINARDAMPDGGRLTIETANAHLDDAYARADDEVRAGDYVAISVSDTGTGMTPEVAAKAFDPFFTTKPIGQGTGLGLSMIYGFAKQSGGHARIDSEVGRGTTVRLYLPRAPSEPAAEPAPAPVATPAGRGETVLVVEDEATVRMLVTDVLEELGYRHVEAPHAQGALALLESDRRIDLLVTDVGLPNMDGRELAEVARRLRPGLKVLFMTGYAENAAVRGGFLAPGMEMLTKPFALDVLGAKLREMIERPGAPS